MAGGANPAMVQPVMNPYQRASSANMQAFNTYSNPAAAAANMMNPYQQQVVDATIRDVGSAAQMGLNQIGAQAQSAGAYGGSRQGIAEAEALKGFNQQALDQVSRLNQQGYQQSINNAFNAAQGLQNVGNQAFGMGNTLVDRQMQQGQMQQAAMQNLINAGKQQFAGFTGQPQQNLNALLSTISAQPNLTGETKSFQPGLFNYLQFAAGLA
tara:strand:+ start:8258 stop:8890 length:633 start_codon:yes stop_codon:yes gene_type:complete